MKTTRKCMMNRFFLLLFSAILAETSELCHFLLLFMEGQNSFLDFKDVNPVSPLLTEQKLFSGTLLIVLINRLSLDK